MTRLSEGQGHNDVKSSSPKQQHVWVWSISVDWWKSY